MEFDASKIDIHQAASMCAQAETKGRTQGYMEGQEDLLNEMIQTVTSSMERNECFFDHDTLVWLESVAKIKSIMLKQDAEDD